MNQDFYRIPLQEAIDNNYIDFVVRHSYSKIDYSNLSHSSILKIRKKIEKMESDISVDFSTPHYDNGIFIVAPIMKQDIKKKSNITIPNISITGIYPNFYSTFTEREHPFLDKDKVIDIISKEIYSQITFALSENVGGKKSIFKKITGHFTTKINDSSFINEAFNDILSAKDKIHDFVENHIVFLGCQDIVISRIISKPIYAINKKNESVELCDLTHSGFCQIDGIFYAKYDVAHRNSGYSCEIIPLITSFNKSFISSNKDFLYFETKNHLLSSSFDIDTDRINSL